MVVHLSATFKEHPLHKGHLVFAAGCLAKLAGNLHMQRHNPWQVCIALYGPLA
jgi:hypothetical protein